tara:strand:+ start:817 stop:2106 length:1290 start_codon:yes stop_codon:yes gene_type:complete
MADSIVDLGAAAVDYVGDKISDAFDYMTGAPEASASGGYYKRLGPGARQYFSGPEEKEGESFFEYLGFEDGGVVELGEGSPMSMATEEEIKEFLKFLRMNRPSYKEGESGKEYRIYSDFLEPTPHNPNARIERDGRIVQLPPIPPSFAGQSMGREEFYEGFADTASGITEEDIQSGVASLADLQDSASIGDPFAGREGRFVPQQIEIEDGKVITNPIGFDDGGEVGIMSALLDPRIDLPSSEQQNVVRASGREGSEGAAMFYPEGSLTFEQVLETRYGYPDDVERGDFDTTTEIMRAERPRADMPTYQELEDARAHALQSALLAKDFGPRTAQQLGGLSEFTDKLMGATPEDIIMDKRNNAFGAKLLKQAGVNATSQQIAQMVDDEVFKQLDVILGREPGKRRFKSPKTGIDVYFPRDRQGFFNVNKYD